MTTLVPRLHPHSLVVVVPKSQAISPLQLTGITMMHKVLVVYYLVAVLCGMSASIKANSYYSVL